MSKDPTNGEIDALRGTVLLVEDHLINRNVATAMLAALGLRSVLADNGKMAVELVREQDFDLVLMDCQMPVMDGFEATSAIRRLPSGRGERLTILALTANAMPGDEERCLAAGMNGFLAKPFTLAQLRSQLARWLPPLRNLPERAAASQPATLTVGPKTHDTDSINPRTLATLRDIGASAGQDLVKSLLHNFVEAADAPVRRIESAIAARDASLISRAAHALKSSAANLGADPLARVYRELESLGREGRVDDARALIATLRHEHERAIARMREILQEAMACPTP
jgi:two-component system, sensor histidine kinase and response regulator